MTEQLVYMSDLLEFAGVLDHAAGSAADRASEQVIHSMGEEVARLAYAYAPKKTHELANSIRAIHGPMESRVVAEAPYAAYVEFGTWSHNVISPRSGTYTIRPKNAKVLRFKGSNGQTVFTQKVEHPGVKAQPFLGPANAEVLERFTTGIATVGVYLVVEG
jgi:hypothetical protein